MKSIVQTALGEPADALELIEREDPGEAGPLDVLVDVALAPVHHGDLHLIRSATAIPRQPGYIPRGSECVGIVREAGADVNRGSLPAGKRVVGFPAPGAWAESIVVPAAQLIPVPDDLGDETAGQLFINYVAARMIMRALLNSVPGKSLRGGTVLVTGASTVVARVLLFMLGEEGIHSAGLARSASSAARIQSDVPQTPIFAAATPEWKAELSSAARGKPIVAVLDCVSGPFVGELAPLLADDCAIITYGGLDKGPIGLSGLMVTDHQFMIRGVTFARWFVEVPREEQMRDIEAAVELARRMPSLFTSAGSFALNDFRSALAAVEAPNRTGFVFLKPH